MGQGVLTEQAFNAQVWFMVSFSQKEIEMRVSSYISTSCTPSAANFLYAAQELSEPSVGRKHILLVEDNPVLQHIHSLWLQDLNYDVTAVNSGEAALAECLSDYDAVLMDLDLPGDDGITTTKKLFRKNSSLTIPVIACTTYAESEMKESCLKAGMVDYLQKPISPARLAQLLKKYVA